MVPKHRNKRLLQLAVMGIFLVIGGYILVQALNNTAQLFMTPSEAMIQQHKLNDKIFKIGGEVVPGSVEKDEGLTTRFSVVDFKKESQDRAPDAVNIKVTYTGVLPDLFDEGEGVVITGQLIAPGEFKAVKLMAKHDSSYQPVME
ncbi:MAG: cytochrome c maturation protein CcmE [Hellea sp.]|nr:cytochrome c maturation protein CcmE [Hellea sp.]